MYYISRNMDRPAAFRRKSKKPDYSKIGKKVEDIIREEQEKQLD